MSITPPITLAQCPVAYKILREDPVTLNGDRDSGWEATIDFLVALSDLTTFAQFCGGSAYTITVGMASVTRYIPLSHPLYTSLLVKRIQSKAIGTYTSGNTEPYKQWSHARVKCTFGSVPYPTDGSTPFMVVRTRAASQEYSLAGKQLAFTDGTPIQADASVGVPSKTYCVTIFQAATLDSATEATCLASPVNSASLTLGDFTAPAGTVRFDSSDSEFTMSTTNQSTYNRTLYLTYRPVEWNKFLRPDGTWDYATKSGGAYVYAASDLNNLFV